MPLLPVAEERLGSAGENARPRPPTIYVKTPNKKMSDPRRPFHRFPNRVFVESGTSEGWGVQAALNAGFQQIISFELHGELAGNCERKFAHDSRVRIVNGDSGTSLGEHIKDIREPITFWLDGHYTGPGSALGTRTAPLLEELEWIRQHPIKTHTILINDRRLLKCTGSATYDGSFGLTEAQIRAKLLEINPEYVIEYVNGFVPQDIIVARVASEAPTESKLSSYIPRESDLQWNNCDMTTNGELWLWNKLKSQLKLIVDVGVAFELTYPDEGKIIQHCFEPIPKIAEQLKKYIRPDRVFINPVGLGASNTTVSFFTHSTSVRSRSHYTCPQNCSCKITVDIIRLDDYIARHKIESIDFIKIDTEGYELDVLKGARNALKITKFVQFEYGGTYPDNQITLAQVFGFLDGAGFGYIYLIQPTSLVRMERPIENYHYSNYFASKTEMEGSFVAN
jgi:FkbM family methyltransferase